MASSGNRWSAFRSRVQKLALPVGAVLSIIAIVSVFVMVHVAETYYRLASQVRLDPAGLKTYETDRARPPTANGKPVVVFFGDSRALMWKPPASDGYAFFDRGVAFQTTAQILLRVDSDLLSLHPSVVVLEAGVNDLKAIAELPDQRDEIVRDCERNMRTLVLRARGTGASVVLTSIFSIGDLPLWRRPFWNTGVEVAVREVNTFLRTLAADRVVFFDTIPVLDDGRGRIKSEFQYDYLHVDSAGYAALDDKLMALLQGISPGR